MQKVAIIAHESSKEELIDALHRAGVVEISETKEPMKVDHTEVNFRAAELKFAIAVLRDHASKETQAAAKKPASEENILYLAKHTDVRGIVDMLHNLEEEDTKAEHIIKEAQQLREALAAWVRLPYSLSAPTESDTTARILGLLPAERKEELHKRLAAKIPRTEIEEIDEREGVVSLAAHVWKKDKTAFEELAITEGWSNVELPVLDGSAAALYEQAQMDMKEMESLKQKNTEKRTQLSVELPNLVKVDRYMQWLHEKQSAREAMSATASTMTLLGWMPKKQVASLEEALQKAVPAVAVLKVKPDAKEEPPVLLRNPKVIAPFESVTNLYGLPLYSELDPTIALTPFFALYFALCLTDAGYGAVLALIFGMVIWKKKLSMRDAKLVWTLFLGGIVAFFVGIPFGGWIGFAPEQVPAFLTKTTSEGDLFFRGQVWNLSSQSGITFLQNLSLVLGLTHLSYGMFLAGYHKWIHGRKAEAMWVDFTSHLLIGSAIFVAAAPDALHQIAIYTLYAVLIIFIWGKGYGAKWFLRPLMGLIGLLNFGIGMLSNTLSYLRILALGLVTGAIAMAVNQVAVEIGKLFPIWIAVPVVIVIFVMGHLVSIALNTLGSFIHSGRLQFIEFFSQFFEGGGRSFVPFRRST